MSGFPDYERYDATGPRRARSAATDLARRAPRRRHRARRGAQRRGQRRDDAALRLRARGDRHGPARRAVHGRAVPHEGPLSASIAGVPDDAELAILRRRAGAHRRQRARRAAQARRPRDLRPHEHVRARSVAHVRAAPARADAQSLGSHAHLRRLERRRGRGGRRAHAPDGARDRRVRLDPARRRRAAVWWGSSPRAGATRWRRGSARGSAAARSSTP